GMAVPKVLATWHPAFVLRDRNHEEELEEDFAAAVRYIRLLHGEELGQTVPWQEQRYDAPGPQSVSPVLSYDIETNGARLLSPEFKMTMIQLSDGITQWVAREP